jgi:hypothetical protein
MTDRPNDRTRSQRTDPTTSLKRGANSAYYRHRLAREHPELLARLDAGEFPSVRAAAKAAGLIKAVTPLEDLQQAWRRATAEDRAAFLALVHSPTPMPKRLRQLTGAIWYESLVMIRQHVLRLRQAGLVENLARAWASQNRHGYAATLRGVIQDLTTVLAQVESVEEEAVRSERAAQDQDRTP